MKKLHLYTALHDHLPLRKHLSMGRSSWQVRSLTLAVGVIMAGCSVGPNYTRPALPLPATYTAAQATAESHLKSDSAQHFVQQDIPAQWWEIFHSPQLNELVRLSLKNNPTVDIAQTNLQQAIENVKAQQAAYFPTVNASYTPTRQRVASPLASPLASNSYVYNLHTAEINASYTLDLWGANRRQVEALKAEADASRYNVEVTYLTLTSNVVNAAILEALLHEQIEITRQAIERQKALTEITRRARGLGQLSDADVATQDAAQAAAEAALPPLQKQLAIQRDLIKALAGEYPSASLDIDFTLDNLHLPHELPLTLPSTLVEHRPDIRAAEALLHAASANVGVATANRLPTITLGVNAYGSSAEKLSDLLKSGSNFWTLAGGVTQPLFDGGALKHKEAAAKMALEGAKAQYRSTVIAAFQNVADVLQSIDADQIAFLTAERAAQASAKSLTLARTQYQLGDISKATLLPIEQSDLQAKLSLAQAQATRLQDSAALFQALGSDWWDTAKTNRAE